MKNLIKEELKKQLKDLHIDYKEVKVEDIREIIKTPVIVNLIPLILIYKLLWIIIYK